jgi:iron complex outermembrane receptor protein
LADLRLGWTREDKRWQITGFVQNVADRRYRIYAFDLTSQLGYVQDLHNKPRTFELSLMYRL